MILFFEIDFSRFTGCFMTVVPQNTDLPFYNSRIIHAYIQLVKKQYPDVNIPELLKYARMNPQEVDDQGHWFTQRQIDLFYERLVTVTGKENIAREAGRFAASPETIGVMRQYILGLATPAKAYELIGKYSANFTRSSKYESRMLAANKVEITVTPYEGVEERPFQCENRKGFFDAITMAFINKPPKIEHPQCLFKGHDACRYIISWEKTFWTNFKLFRNYAALIFPLICLILITIYPVSTLLPYISAGVLFVLGIAFVSEKLEKNNLTAAMLNLKESSDQLVDQIEINYNNRLVTREIGQIINRHTKLDNVLDEVIQVLQNRLDFDRGMIMLADNDKTRLKFHAGFGYSPSHYEALQKLYFHLDNPASRGIFVVSFKEHKPFLVNDINEIQDSLSQRSFGFAQKMGAKSFICCPIICDNESIGVLAVDNIRTKRLLVHSDTSLLMGISHFIGVSIRHTQHLESREQQLNSVLKVLVSSIDARDALTKGHSEMVAEYAVGICNEIGLNKDFQEVVRISALLHDYGKIAIPDSMLKKKDKLTPQEYEYVKYHADKTKEILDKINFEGPLKEVPFIAGSHHERYDGSGYPRGLAGDEIPLGARIIAVADYFEALTASRYYSEPMAPEDVIGKLSQYSGSLFDKNIVDAFIRYYRNSYSEMKEESALKIG
jgi:HD-GYP domain-containing protein (c-di-GMP phosphodiesterase class II)